MATLSKGSLFPEVLIPGLIKKTKGESALAKLCSATPIEFNGQKEFTFTFDKEIDIVAENGAKGAGGVTVGSRTIVPIKVEYSARVSDEFMYGSEDYKLNVLEAFSDGFAKKLAKGIDIMAFHGVNPRTGTSSAIIGTNSFDGAVINNVITIAEDDTPDENVESAIAFIQDGDYDVTGMVMAPAFKSRLASMTKSSGDKVFPDLAWGNSPSTINGLRVEATSNLSFGSSLDRAIVGDFENGFKWGYAKEIPMEVIEYGNPDNDPNAGDLKGHNQVLLRCEAYVGWGVLEPDAFAIIKEAAAAAPVIGEDDPE